MSQNKYIDREKSWLAFNARVLQEAADETVPLLERLRFLGIFSNNLDEFFRVRFAAIRRLNLSGISGEKVLGGISSKQLLDEITEIVIQKQNESLKILSIIEKKLQLENIFIVNENEVTKEQEAFLKEFFIQKAIGWALREYGKTNPNAVKIFVSQVNLYPFSAKEALKNMC